MDDFASSVSTCELASLVQSLLTSRTDLASFKNITLEKYPKPAQTTIMSNTQSKASSVQPILRSSLKLYNSNKFRRGNPIVFPHEALLEASQHPVRLVPIRLDLEVDGIKIRDSFSWNLNETLVTPEQFALLLIEDVHDGSPSLAQNLVTQIANSIRTQCQAWENAVHDEEDAVDFKRTGNAEEEDGLRTLIRLDLQVGQLHLVDQFEWPMMPYSADELDHPTAKNHPTPESFASQLCAELGIGGEFVSIIAHSIREQLCYARLNFDEAPKLQKLDVPPIRGADFEGDWQPQVEHLSEEEIDRRFKEQERTARRVRRSQRITTSNTIVINRSGSYEEIDSDEEGGKRKSRASFMQAQKNLSMNTGQKFQPYPMAGQQRMMGNYASFSAIPMQYTQNMFSQYGAFRQQQPPKAVPYKNYKPSPEEEEAILRKLEETINLKNLAPPKSPPKKHRGFGASAQRFNSDGQIPVGEFREKWRCSWCLMSGKFTPTLRKGPMGSKTLCNACGIWYGKHGSLPQDRYQEHGGNEG